MADTQKDNDRVRINQLVRSGYSDEDINETIQLINKGQFPNVGHYAEAQYRATLELILATRKFDRASGALVSTTNRLTTVILVLTVLAVLFAGGSVYLSLPSAP